MRGELEQAERYFEECIKETEDDYIKLRAYSKLDEAYQAAYVEAEQYDKRIALLTEALEKLPAGNQITLIERMAQVYIDYSDLTDRDENYKKAIALFDRMEDMGYATFSSRYNAAVLYHMMGNVTKAETRLEDMLLLYPDNYIIYKRMAYVELDIQNQRVNGKRDYHSFQNYYNQALSLYQRNAQEDMEMLSLQQMYNDVVANGWL